MDFATLVDGDSLYRKKVALERIQSRIVGTTKDVDDWFKGPGK
jgi:hypothetical protein